MVMALRLSIPIALDAAATMAVDGDRDVELECRPAGRVRDARLDVALLTGTPEAVAAADRVVARHAFHAVRHRRAEVAPDRRADADAYHVLIGDGVEVAL